MTAVWKNAILVVSDQTKSNRREHFFPRKQHATRPWKGLASYYHLRVGVQTNEDAAWSYAEPKEAANSIKNRVAFWRGVKVVE